MATIPPKWTGGVALLGVGGGRQALKVNIDNSKVTLKRLDLRIIRTKIRHSVSATHLEKCRWGLQTGRHDRKLQEGTGKRRPANAKLREEMRERRDLSERSVEEETERHESRY